MAYLSSVTQTLQYLGYSPDVHYVQIGAWDSIRWLVPDPPSDEEIIAAALPALRSHAHDLRRARRTEAELSGFSFSGHPLDSDRDSILRIANAAASAISALLTQQAWATAWRCADEHDLPLDAAGMLALQGALAMHGQVCHTVSTTIAAEIEAAETAEQVEAILAAIPTDARWPA